MGEVVRLMINEEPAEIQVREYQGQRVVTFRDIDELHQRPEGTAARNFSSNKKQFVEGVDFFRLTQDDTNHTKNVELLSPNGLTVFTESGYLMLVKSLTDDLAWQVQRELVNRYFKAKPASTLDALEAMIRGMREQEQRLTRVEETNQQQARHLNVLNQRVNILDHVDITGDERQQLDAMVNKYTLDNGLQFGQGWKDFDRAYNTAFNTNLTLLRKQYAKKHGLKKDPTRPEYLEAVGKLPDALRIADRMLNRQAG